MVGPRLRAFSREANLSEVRVDRAEARRTSGSAQGVEWEGAVERHQGCFLADSKQDTSTVEIGREFAVVGSIFPFMRKLRSGRTSSTRAGKSTMAPSLFSALFNKLQSFLKAAVQGVMLGYSMARARSTNRLKESDVLLSRCAQQLAVKVKYPSLFWVM